MFFRVKVNTDLKISTYGRLNQSDLLPTRMAPLLSGLSSTMTEIRMTTAGAAFNHIKSQWNNPTGVIPILSLIGGHIVQRAVAQLSGHPSHITPVAFSFGWAGYALNTAFSITRKGRLMPPPEYDCIVVSMNTQVSIRNKSWILARLVRDIGKDPAKGGLTVSFYKTILNGKDKKQGVPTLDWVYFSGIVVIITQIGIATIPGVVFHDWTIFLVTTIGTALSLCGGALPKWRVEKWNGRKTRKGDRSVICLTRGHGYSDAMIIISEGEGHYRLEDLANARDAPVSGTPTIALILSGLQLLLLLVVAALQDHAWFLIAIGTLGIVQNALAAGTRRDLGTTGIHLQQMRDPVSDRHDVLKALRKAEEIEPYVGVGLFPVFFPGGLQQRGKQWRNEKLQKYEDECCDEHKGRRRPIEYNKVRIL